MSKITQWNGGVTTVPALTDLIPYISDPGGTPSNEITTPSDLLGLSASGGIVSIDGLPASPNASNHEFTTDLGSFVAHTGTDSGATMTMASTSAGKYHVQDSFVMAQPASGSHVYLRLDRTLADGESVVVKLLAPGDSQQFCGIVLNDLDSDPNSTTTANRQSLWLDVASTRIILYDGGSAVNNLSWNVPGSRIYFRVLRSGTAYYHMVSSDGWAWRQIGSITSATAPSNVWLYFRQDGGASTPATQYGCDWVRFGDAGYQPWSYTGTPA